ncbi:MAG: alcohol dehydrogenase catalytic domain-containing protein [Desulfobacterales bacterium]|jgi:L-iditol 2-dehydrogenase|nr:alcohol dehydrogenase catalytic domain-containing protein [Desulfobacteraceae bacterium]MBT7697990.1 alcohol dehydrogenase catalytic domain-containing protein [Desulfobacterales bacterium]
MMKVATWYNNKDIRIEKVPKPKPGPNEMLVKVISCGICGSDIAEWYRLPRAPLVPGHEIGGIVAETGKSVKKYKQGDRVFVAPKIPCMKCSYCKNGHFPVCQNTRERLPGGFSEYINVPETLVENGTYRLPDRISYNQSTFIEPLACVVRAQKLSKVHEGQTVLVIGCGISGLIHVKLAKAKNCKVIAVDINRQRLEFAKKIGADLIIDATENISGNLLDGSIIKADIVLLCTSSISAIDLSWKCVDKGGTIVFFAVPEPDKEVVIPINDFWTNEIKILTSYYCGPPDILEAINLIKTGTIEISDMITHELPLNDIMTGFQLVAEPEKSMKVIIRPNG